jgi:hypothetical protein
MGWPEGVLPPLARSPPGNPFILDAPCRLCPTSPSLLFLVASVYCIAHSICYKHARGRLRNPITINRFVGLRPGISIAPRRPRRCSLYHLCRD